MVRPRRTSLWPQKLSDVFKTERGRTELVSCPIIELDTIFFQIVEIHSSTKMYLKYGLLDLLVDYNGCSRPQLHLQLFELFKTPFKAKYVLSVVSTILAAGHLGNAILSDFSICPDGLAFLVVEASIQGYGTRSVED